MAITGNQHCANCIGTLLFSITVSLFLYNNISVYCVSAISTKHGQ